MNLPANIILCILILACVGLLTKTIFFVSLITFSIVIGYILYIQNANLPVTGLDDTGPSSGKPISTSSYVGEQCPVGCTCFPRQNATGKLDEPQTVCAYLDNMVMFECPPNCCTPSCF